MKLCLKCKGGYSGNSCEKCIFISATEEADAYFEILCQRNIVLGIEVLDDKKTSGKSGVASQGSLEGQEALSH